MRGVDLIKDGTSHYRGIFANVMTTGESRSLQNLLESKNVGNHAFSEINKQP